MAPVVRGRRGRRNNASRWEFLRPWIDVLRSGVQPVTVGPMAPASLEVTLHCWSMPATGRLQRMRDCQIIVQFPADAASRADTQRLQKLREAIELLNALAAVDSQAFQTLLADLIQHNEEFMRAYAGNLDGVRAHPEWTCQLMGSLARDDFASTHSPVNWGELFGCPRDPWESSDAFRAAALQIEAMDTLPPQRGLMFSTKWKTLQDAVPVTAWREEPSDAWGGATPINAWEESGTDAYGERLPHPMKDTLTRPTEMHFVREMRRRWQGVVPVIAQVAAVRFGLDVFNAWARSGQPQENLTHGITRTPHFESPFMMVSGIVWAHNGFVNLTMSLDDRSVGRRQWGDAVAHMGFFFSIVICGKAMTISPLERRMSYPFVNLVYSWTTNATLAAMASALSEAHKVESLAFKPSDDDREMQPVNHERWKWLAFALFSNASNGAITQLELSKIRLTRRDVAEVAAVMQSGFPQPKARDDEHPVHYGHVDVQKGTALKVAGLPTGNQATIVLSRDVRCRALYDPASNDHVLSVVVPGHGVCHLERERGQENRFIADPPEGVPERADRGCGVEVLESFFLRPDSGDTLTDMLALIGRNLRALTIAETPDVHITVDVGSLAAACPRLKQLMLTCYDVAISNLKGLAGWGVEHLVLVVNKEVPNLAECLSDSRFFRQLKTLQVVILSYASLKPRYIRALEAHNGECIPVVKEKLSMPSKAALLSVLEARTGIKRFSGEKAKSSSKTFLDVIFEMAAKPERRSVRVGSTR